MAKVKSDSTNPTPETEAVASTEPVETVEASAESVETVATEGTSIPVAPPEKPFVPGSDPKLNQVEFSKPQKDVETYLSTKPKGYTVALNEDRRAWTIMFDEEVISNDTVGRKVAFFVADNHAKGIKPEEAAPIGPSLNSATEAKVIDYLIEKEAEGPQSISLVAKNLEMDFAGVMGQFSNLSRRSLIVIADEGGATVTDRGKEARSNFNPDANKTRMGKHKRVTKAQRKAARARPEGIGPAPSAVEFAEIRLYNAEASMAYTKVLERIHPHSEIIKKKILKTQERIDLIKIDIQKEKDWEAANGGKPRAAGGKLKEDDSSTDSD